MLGKVARLVAAKVMRPFGELNRKGKPGYGD
jgi:hypothetical protein